MHNAARSSTLILPAKTHDVDGKKAVVKSGELFQSSEVLLIKSGRLADAESRKRLIVDAKLLSNVLYCSRHEHPGSFLSGKAFESHGHDRIPDWRWTTLNAHCVLQVLVGRNSAISEKENLPGFSFSPDVTTRADLHSIQHDPGAIFRKHSGQK